MIGIVAASHYLQPVDTDAGLPSLEAELKELCREPFRRIDRFIQLALLGSGRCVAGQDLQPDCGLYLGSGLGPIGNNVVTQQQLIRDREIPKPFNFINTLGSSAGFYVARNLDLHGQNLFVSRRGASLEAVLNLAIADLSLGIVSQALVGVVEEVVPPLAVHRQRQQLSATQALVEGSHWLLLQSDRPARRRIQLHRFDGFDQLEEWLASAWNSGDCLCCATGMERSKADTLKQRFSGRIVSDWDGAFHNSLEAAWLTEFATGDEPGNLFVVNGNAVRGWVLFHLGP
ncbi:MAG: beta-ketoacyl synthase N-terminal-like domain-containing protein [Gammaproteobacteria bacterium]